MTQNTDPSKPDFTPVGYMMKCRDTHQMHPYVAYDAVKAAAFIKAMKHLGGRYFRASPDLVHMLVGTSKSAAAYGYHLRCDPKLPENTVVPA